MILFAINLHQIEKNVFQIVDFNSGYSYYVGTIEPDGALTTSRRYASNVYSVHPAVYLNSNIKITGGEGSQENPYTLAL